jgi:hypothetical protein
MTATWKWAVLLGVTLAWPALAGEKREEGSARPFRMPPQEAQAACAALKLDDACRFTFDGRAHTGTCRRGPGGEGPIACAPDRGGERGERGERGGARREGQRGGQGEGRAGPGEERAAQGEAR